MRRTQLFLTEELHHRLKAEAFDKNITLSEHVRFILEKHLQQVGREDTEKGIQTLLKMGEEEDE